MKKMKNLFMALLVGMFMLPVMNATGETSTPTPSVDADAKLTSLSIKAGEDELAGSFNADTATLTLNQQAYTVQNLLVKATAANDLVVTVNDDIANSTVGNTVSLEEGSNSIVITVTKGADGSNPAKTSTYVVSVSRTQIPTPKLSALSVKVGTDTANKITFNANTNEYTLSVDYDVDKVKLEATADATTDAVLDGTVGDCELNAAANEITTTICNVVVKNKNIASKTNTYKVTVSRAAKPAAELTGLSVKVGSGDNLVDFNKNTTTYTVEVPYGTTEVNVDATVADASKYTISGLPENKKLTLEDGYASLEITVTIAGNTKIYYVDIYEEDNPENKKVEDALKAKDINAEVDVKKDLVRAVIYTSLADDSVVSKYYEVKISETATTDEIVAAIEEAMEDKAVWGIIDSEAEEKVLTEEIIKAVKDSKEELLVSGGNGAWIFNGKNLTNDYKDMKLNIKLNTNVEEELRNKVLELVEDKENALVIDFANEGKLPKGTRVMIPVGGYDFGDEELTLYYYNTKSGKLNVVAKKLKVKTNDLIGRYVEVELDHTSTYVLTTSNNNAQTGVLNVVLYATMALGSLAGIVFLLKKKAN